MITPGRQWIVNGVIGVAGAIAGTCLLWYAPTVGGQSLARAVASATAFSALAPSEYDPLVRWLAADACFVVLCAVVFTWTLRLLAASAPTRALDLFGRVLSWVAVSTAIVGLTEDLILYVGAATAAPLASPWFATLVWLRWLPAAAWGLYVAAWGSARIMRRGRGGEARAPGG